MAAAGQGFFGKAILIGPLAFAIGLSLSEFQKGAAEEDAVVEKRVQQRLGIWRPPPLSIAERQRLEEEAANLRVEIGKLRSKMASRKASDSASNAIR
jgi:hypothetical protein